MKRFPLLQSVLWKRSALLFLLLTTSCTWADGMSDPDKVLERAVAAVYGKDNFAFQGYSSIENSGILLDKHLAFEGFVVNQNQMYMKTTHQPPKALETHEYYKARNGLVYIKNNRHWTVLNLSGQQQNLAFEDWNPLYRFHLMRLHKQHSEMVRSLSSPEVIVIQTELEPVAAKQAVIDSLKGEYDKTVSSNPLSVAGEEPKSSEETRLSGEYAALRQKSQRQLKEMEASLNVETSVQLWIDRIKGLPQKMKMVTQMSYRLDGKPRTEKRVDTYTFSKYDGRFAIPSS